MPQMRIYRRGAIAALTALCVGVLLAGAGAAETPITAKGQALAAFLDGLGVETKWPAGVRVDWESGLPNGRPIRSGGKHTHCSAFTASAAKQLGVYILRPPEHSPVLLANAQSDWFATAASRDLGWAPVTDAVAAQEAANQGRLVIAIYRNHRDDKPGHTAIVRPSSKSLEEIIADGPDVIQAGGTNYRSTTLKRGFAGHRAAWGKHEVRFFAHDIALPAG